MEEFLSALGAKPKEVTAFKNLIELGAQPVSILAKRLGLPRSSTYLIMDKLRELGLIEEFERGGIKYVKCISPEEIHGLLMAKKRSIDQLQNMYEEVLPQLNTLANRLSITPLIKYFEGKDAVMSMYEEVLQGQSFDAIFNPDVLKRMMPEYHYVIPTVAKSPRVHLRELLVAGEEARIYKKKFECANHKIFILPDNMEFSSDTIITENEIYMVAYGEEDISGIEIRNPILAHSQKVLFESLWERYSSGSKPN